MSKRTAAVMLVGALSLVLMGPSAVSQTPQPGETAKPALTGFARQTSFADYLDRYRDLPLPTKTVVIPAAHFSSASGTVELIQDLDGLSDPAVKTGEEGQIEWKFWIDEPGLYRIAVTYYPVEGRRGTIQRDILVNGERPYEEAGYLNFHRVWGDAHEPKDDNQGNQIRPVQVETPVWRTIFLEDAIGNYDVPLCFYFHQGINTITLVSRREPMVIAKLVLEPAAPLPSYAEVCRIYQEMQYQPVTGHFDKIQGEKAAYRSSPTLFAIHDRTDPTLEPYHPALIRLNAIGGQRWSRAGDWIAWEVEVPKSGLYTISFKAKQKFVRGSFVNRRLMINGEVPFQEAAAIRFPFSSRYQMVTLGPEDGEPYLFYLHEGKNIIQLDVVMGDLAEIIRIAEDSLYELNTIYRRIVMITSTKPDPIRDYQLGELIPDVIARMREQSDVFGDLAGRIAEIAGEQGTHVALLNELAFSLKKMAEDPERIPRSLKEFRDNAGALGEWILTTREQPLQIDYLIVAGVDQQLPSARPTLWQAIAHEFNSFIASFKYNYDLVGDVHQETDRTLKVWIGLGRDQAQILKEMIEDSFTPQTGIAVNLELINMGILLPATLAGRGPDVAMGVPSSQPVEFAIRSAVVDLTSFPDFPEVAAQFMPSALVPFTFRDSVYAVPETQSFPMLFYRKDILTELGFEVPRTWEEFIRIIPELKREHMEVGVPYSGVAQAASGALGESTATVSVLSHGGVQTFLTFLYQQGVSLYQWDGIATNLDLKPAVQSFITWTEFYELYDLPMWYDPANRFRMGEMPLVIVDYQMYNTLTVFAPELRGEWGFTLVPGTPQDDGEINHSVPSQGTGTMIMKAAKDHDAAWEFVKWWASVETQARFGQELESVLGPAARYPTANILAARELPWTIEEYEILEEQRRWAVGVPNVPGAYMVGRHLDNAFRKVVYAHEPPREVLLDYNRAINDEIAIKRAEFNLPTAIDELPKQWRKYLEFPDREGEAQ